ncbi:MAG: S9 family peptidase, partial [Shewanella sp.]
MIKNRLASSFTPTLKRCAAPLLIMSQLAMIAITPAYGLEGGHKPLTIERIHASPALAGSSPRSLTLSPDGQRVAYLVGRKD